MSRRKYDNLCVVPKSWLDFYNVNVRETANM